MLQIGDTLSVDKISSDCSSLSSNFVSLFFSDPALVDGGMIMSSLGDTVEICVSDGENDFLSYTHSTSSASLYSYLITEPGGKILAVTTDTIVNFEQIAPGECWIYGISHTIPVTQFQGADLQDIFTEGCFSLSTNKIVIYKTSGDQQLINAEQDAFSVCVGDGQEDWIDFTIGENSQGKEVLFVTDNESVIQAVVDSSSINFENLSGGISWVWGISYGGELLLGVGDTLFGREISTLCYSLTSNFIVVDKVGLTPFSVSTTDGDTLISACVGNNIPDDVAIISVNLDPSSNIRYVLIDKNDVILRIQENNVFDIENLDAGTCSIRGLSYGGDLLAGRGDTLTDETSISSDCWIWSNNQITIEKNEIHAGSISTENEQQSITICSQNESDDIIYFELFNQDTGYQSAYVITNAVEEIISVFTADSMDFNDSPEGICLIYGIVYNGDLTVTPGELITASNLASDCFGITNNAIEIVKAMADGGTISTLQGQDSILFCVADDSPDRVIFTESTFSFAKYSYLITDTNGMLIEMLNIPAKDFGDELPGVCRVYGLSYTGELLDSLAGQIDSIVFSEDCYDLSDNYITVIKSEDPSLCEDQLVQTSGKIQASVLSDHGIG